MIDKKQWSTTLDHMKEVTIEKKQEFQVLEPKKKGLIALALLIGISVIVYFVWQAYLSTKEKDIISANGRIEATEINIAPRLDGQIKEIFAQEGDYVKPGQVLVQMDTDILEAQLKEAQGILLTAKSNVAISKSKLIEKESEKVSAEAALNQREAELEVAKKTWDRSSTLVLGGATSQQTVDDNYASYKSALAAKNAAVAQVEAADAVIVTTQKEIIGSEAAVEAATGTVERIQTEINDSALKTPEGGKLEYRMQYRVSQPGEVLAAGGTVLNLIDLGDIYMSFFLPTTYTGRVAMGQEVRVILDAEPETVIPAKITFISDVAQFTPKSVETRSEREKLTFRVKARVLEDYLKKNVKHLSTGLPGMAYIRINPEKPWPDYLEENKNK